MDKNINILAETQMFKGVDKAALGGIIFLINPRVKKYRKGSFILNAGEPVRETGIVLNGTLQVIKEDIHGNRSIINIIRPGDMFAEALACANIQQSPVSVIAITDCEIIFINFDKVISLRGEYANEANKIIKNMLLIIARKNIFLNSKLEHASKRTIREKLLSYLNETALKAGKPNFTLPISKTNLADYLFIDRSAMSRELTNMKAEGIIDFNGNDFKLKRGRR